MNEQNIFALLAIGMGMSMLVLVFIMGIIASGKRHEWEIIKEYETNRFIIHTLKCVNCGAMKSVSLKK